MNDTSPTSPDHNGLFALASEQHGYFTAAQARAYGFNWDLLTYHTHQGRFVRVRRGLYRLRDYPTSPREEIVAAWIAVGKDKAVVSHDTALDLLGLSDVVPDAIHLTVPRSMRYLPELPGVIIHTTIKPMRLGDTVIRDGVRLTVAGRTILDAAEAGTAPEQIEMAITQAIERGMVNGDQLRKDANDRGKRVAKLVASALNRVKA